MAYEEMISDLAGIVGKENVLASEEDGDRGEGKQGE